MEDQEPVRADPPAGTYQRTDWTKYTDGEWWRVRDVPHGTNAENKKENHRRLMAARAWAGRHGFIVQRRTARFQRELYLRFQPDPKQAGK